MSKVKLVYKKLKYVVDEYNFRKTLAKVSRKFRRGNADFDPSELNELKVLKIGNPSEYESEYYELMKPMLLQAIKERRFEEFAVRSV